MPTPMCPDCNVELFNINPLSSDSDFQCPKCLEKYKLEIRRNAAVEIACKKLQERLGQWKRELAETVEESNVVEQLSPMTTSLDSISNLKERTARLRASIAATEYALEVLA